MIESSKLPRNIYGIVPLESTTGKPNTCHCQGICVDTEKKYIYMSFTTSLLKMDLAGNVVGSVTGLLGHLGCIDFNDRDGKVYGSLEYKNDIIGKNILAHLGSEAKIENAFHIAIFDVEKIDRIGMDASRDGVMKTVYLRDPVDDFHATAVNQGREFEHRYGVSGIDGTSFGPMPGADDGRQYLFVACGIYSDLERTDNDHNIILCYDTSDWDDYAQPLNQENMHHSGPEKPLHRFWVFTGNTRWGVQNLEYDAYSNTFIMCVYPGEKPQYANDPCFLIDAGKAPVKGKLVGIEPEEEGELLTLYGSDWHYHYGSTGIHSFGDGYFYVSYHGNDPERGQYTNVRLCKWDGKGPIALVED